MSEAWQERPWKAEPAQRHNGVTRGQTSSSRFDRPSSFFPLSRLLRPLRIFCSFVPSWPVEFQPFLSYSCSSPHVLPSTSCLPWSPSPLPPFSSAQSPQATTFFFQTLPLLRRPKELQCGLGTLLEQLRRLHSPHHSPPLLPPLLVLQEVRLRSDACCSLARRPPHTRGHKRDREPGVSHSLPPPTQKSQRSPKRHPSCHEASSKLWISPLQFFPATVVALQSLALPHVSVHSPSRRPTTSQGAQARRTPWPLAAVLWCEVPTLETGKSVTPFWPSPVLCSPNAPLRL
mmetsp:Transcript_50610/g.134747  ORF Transcript_50610/g.134747 Transcript_50610/m.134747 type:complete len:288 (+) Transcript_50610:191-1054(+)